MNEPSVEQGTDRLEADILERCKASLADPALRIKLHDLLMLETSRLYTAAFPAINSLTDLTAQDIAGRLTSYRSSADGLLSCFVLGGRWAEKGAVRSFADALEWIATPPSPTGPYSEVGRQLQYYPALLLFYAGGISALASQNWELLAALVADPHIHTQYEADMPLVEAVNPSSVLELQVARLLPGKERQRTPVSGMVEEDLREPLRYLFWDTGRYIRYFDLFEYLMSVLYGEIRIKREQRMWVPAGTYTWRITNQSASPMSALDAIVQQAPDDWPLFQRGLLGGSYDAFTGIKTQVASYLASPGRW